MLLANRPLLIASLVLFTLLQALIGSELMSAGFDWRPLTAAPIVKVAMLDFTFTIVWCALYLLDEAKRQGRNAWAWLPLLFILPTAAVFLFSLTAPRAGRQEEAAA